MIYCQRLTVKQRLSNLSLILLKLIPEVRSFSTKEKVIKVNLELTNIIEEFSQHEDATSLELKSLTKAQNIIFSMQRQNTTSKQNLITRMTTDYILINQTPVYSRQSPNESALAISTVLQDQQCEQVQQTMRKYKTLLQELSHEAKSVKLIHELHIEQLHSQLQEVINENTMLEQKNQQLEEEAKNFKSVFVKLKQEFRLKQEFDMKTSIPKTDQLA